MNISMTLGEILKRCNNWDLFCEEQGWSVYVCAEGGDHISTFLTEEEAIKYGIIKV